MIYQPKVTDLVAMKSMMGGVKRFHDACGIVTPSSASIPTPDRVELRQKLIREEVCDELLPALERGDLPKIADGIADAIVVLLGTALEYGIPEHIVWGIVLAANDAKIDPESGFVRKRADGKILKPEGWVAPDGQISGVLASQLLEVS
jgi:predicted HAD superfamily Cof-like phosphohydrolase